MDRLNLSLQTFDVGASPAGPSEFAAIVADRVETAWAEGADLVLLPEFLWLGLERFVPGDNSPRRVAEMFWDNLWPGLFERLARPDKAAVLGTVPFVDGSGALRNRAPIINGVQPLHQDKIHLTPWEDQFAGGGPLHLWSFQGTRIAVVICLDIEIPEISVALRGSGVDLLLVPSATESLMGVERVGRCASARAVEIGCHVALSHLVGRMESQLIDENLGRLAVFSPSQAVFANQPRESTGDVFTEGFHRMDVALDLAAIRQNRLLTGETDPSKVATVSPAVIGC